VRNPNLLTDFLTEYDPIGLDKDRFDGLSVLE